METTLSEVKKHLRANWEKGCKCPACGNFVKLYKRKLNSGMAIVLIVLYKYGIDFIHVKDFLRENKMKNGHDWTLLKYWGLIQERSPIIGEENTKNSGFWRITKEGIDFVENRLEVKKHVLIYNKKFIGFSEQNIKINDSLGDDFDYYELMKTI
jgi:hypothetical protein